ncbi:MAG TPA: hypothetical protein VFF52_09190 [Isosphaeraceae bacterium]|nr:hypothetical protein [Isosphaeraceae bacterium]
MRKPRSFTASGFDRLEGRVVLSQAAGPGVIHGHKAALVAADFANFQSAFNSTITPIVQDMQNALTTGQYQQYNQDAEQISTDINALVNGLGNQLANQLHSKYYARIRSVVTGAPTPSPVSFASSTPATGSLRATLNTLPSNDLANPGLVHNLVTVYKDAVISGHTARAVSGDFVNFQKSFEKTITPMVEDLQTTATGTTGARNPQLDAAITELVNSLGNQLSNDLGVKGQSAIRSLITGQSAPGSVSFTSGTPVAGSLLATLMSVPQGDLDNWDLIDDLVTVYASSSTAFK